MNRIIPLLFFCTLWQLCVCAQSAPPDSCTIKTFVRTYTSSDSADIFQEMLETTDGNYLLSGTTASSVSGSLYALLIKTRNDGSVIWQKNYPLIEVQSFIQAINTPDNGYLILGNNNQSSGVTGFFVLKIDADGKQLWGRKLFTSANATEARRIVAGADSAYYVLGSFAGILSEEQATITKLNLYGNQVWSRSYASPVDSILLFPNDIAEDGDNVMAIGAYYDIGLNHNYTGFVFSVQKSNGNVNWSNQYIFPNTSSPFVQIQKFNDQFILNAYLGDTAGNAGTIKMNKNGEISTITKIKSLATYTYDHQAVNKKGQVYHTNTYNDPVSGMKGLTIYQLDSNLQVTWTKKYSQYGAVIPNKIIVTGTQQLLVAGYSNGSTAHSAAQLLRFDESGNLSSCPSDLFSYQQSIPDYRIKPFVFSKVGTVDYEKKDIVLNELISDVVLTNTDCVSKITCDSIHISGNAAICNLQDTVIYRATRSPGCTSPVDWVADSSLVKIISATDSTLQLTFRKPGNGVVYAQMILSCSILHDSISIHISDPGLQFSLGPDKPFCKDGTNLIDAGPGFISYLWQDGSTDPIYHFSEEGIYAVSVTDYCGNHFSDTIAINGTRDAPQHFLAAADSICSGDQLILHAIGNWAAYQWSDSTVAAVTSVSLPGSYWLEVTDTGGCSAADTIMVAFKKNCMADIYFPNAFTPNRDSHNDVFRPIITGSVDQFRLMIFDRLGRKIYETSNASVGWDGTMNGRTLDTGTFIWFADYHLRGSTVDTHAKGTVCLVH